MDGNRDDAQRCLHMAAAALAASDLAKAARLLDKSRRMFPLARDQDALAAAIAAARGASTRPKPASAKPTSAPKPAASAPPTRKRDDSAKAPPPRPATPAMRSAVRAVLHPPDKTHYDVLSVPRDADQDAIKRAYRKLALRLHPDRNFADDAENAFKRVSRAFMTLSDAARREHYDRCGADDPADPPPQSRGAAAQHAPHFQTAHSASFFCNRQPGMRAQPMDFDTFIRVNGGAVSPDDLLNFLFTGTAPRASATTARQRRRAARSGGENSDSDDDAGAGAPRQRRRRRSGGADGGEAEAEEAEADASIWARVRPHLWIVLFVLFSLLLTERGERAPFGLHRSAAHPVRHETRNGSPFFTAAASGAARDPRVWRAVDSATLEQLRASCAREREHEASLRAQSRAWLAGHDAREEARRRLAALRKPGCESALKLYDAMRRYG